MEKYDKVQKYHIIDIMKNQWGDKGSILQSFGKVEKLCSMLLYFYT